MQRLQSASTSHAPTVASIHAPDKGAEELAALEDQRQALGTLYMHRLRILITTGRLAGPTLAEAHRRLHHKESVNGTPSTSTSPPSLP